MPYLQYIRNFQSDYYHLQSMPYRNDVYGHLEEDLANKLTFDGDTRRLIADALKVERVGVSNYTKILKEKGILNDDKKSFNKRYRIPDLNEFTIKFE